MNEYYVRDGPNVNFPVGHHGLANGHPVSSNYVPQQVGPDPGGEVFQDPSAAGHRHIPLGYAYGVDSNVNMLPHGHLHPPRMWRNGPNAIHGASYEVSQSHSSRQLNGMAGPGFLRASDGSPMFCGGVDSQIPRVEPSQKMFDFDGSGPDKSGYFPESQHSYVQDMLQAPQGRTTNGINMDEVVEVGKKELNEQGTEANNVEVPDNKVVDTEPKEKFSESSSAICLREKETGGKVVISLSEVNVSEKTASLVGEGDLKAEVKNEVLYPANFKRSKWSRSDSEFEIILHSELW